MNSRDVDGLTSVEISRDVNGLKIAEISRDVDGKCRNIHYIKEYRPSALYNNMNNKQCKDIQKWKEKKWYYKLGGDRRCDLLHADYKLSPYNLIREDEEVLYRW